jgi:hypothetical protein
MLTDSDHKVWSFLKLLTIVPKVQLRKRLIENELRLGEVVTTRERYQGLKRVNIEIQRETRTLLKTKKFSGYIKSLASRGKNQLGSVRIELTAIDLPDFKVEMNMSLLWESWLGSPSLESLPAKGKV